MSCAQKSTAVQVSSIPYCTLHFFICKMIKKIMRNIKIVCSLLFSANTSSNNFPMFKQSIRKLSEKVATGCTL